jgi:glycosyltransferase involved in cell wall biosynthesis
MTQWVLVAGGFHRNGGMDRLNRALARHLIERGNSVHLVCHSVEPDLQDKAASVEIVPRPGNSFLLGGFLLGQRGREVAQRLTRQSSRTRVVINGGNCNWPDVNWTHCVHHAWERNDRLSPGWFKLKNRSFHWQACRRELSALRRARVVIANSKRTRRDLINHMNIPDDRIHVVYPGADPNFTPPTACERAEARAWLGKDDQPLVAFVGALGYDSNKGFDVMFSAWRSLCSHPAWNADLIVAGGGRATDFWRQQIAEAGLDGRIMLLGFTERIPKLLAAADLLVSPVRYEAYGLNVHEAICCGVPAMVTRSAGVAERYPAELRELLIDDPEDSDALADRLFCWHAAISSWRQRIASLSEVLRRHTLDIMAKQIVEIANPHTSEEAA